jgi:hypothetical protein
MIIANLGTALVEHCSTAEDEVMLVAPFIKAGTLERILEGVSRTVQVRVVVRWRPDDILAGVSDLEIWPHLRDKGSILFVRPDLHAKYYRVDDRCLIGSANLTDSALGWRPHSNLELLSAISSNNRTDLFEATLFDGAVQIDDVLFGQMQMMIEALSSLVAPVTSLTYEVDPAAIIKVSEPYNPELSEPFAEWLPKLRHPEQLFAAYSGNLAALTRTAQEAALSDLAAFHIPPGLSRSTFVIYIGWELMQKPVVRSIDELLVKTQRFGAIRAMLRNRFRHLDRVDFTDEWQALMRWLLYFLPRRYGVREANYSEIFYRRVDEDSGS